MFTKLPGLGSKFARMV